MGAAYPANTLKPPTSPFTFQFSVYMYIVSNQVPMMIDVRQNIDTVPMSMLIHPDYRTEKAELFLLLSRVGSLPPATGCQPPAAKCWFPAAGCQLPLKKATLSFQQSGFFIPCRGRELIAAECCLCCLLNQRHSLSPCPSVPSVGCYISLPQIIVGESEELSMLSS